MQPNEHPPHDFMSQLNIHRYYWDRIEACRRLAMTVLGWATALMALLSAVTVWKSHLSTPSTGTFVVLLVLALAAIFAAIAALGKEENALRLHYDKHHRKVPYLPPLEGTSRKVQFILWTTILLVWGVALTVVVVWVWLTSVS